MHLDIPTCQSGVTRFLQRPDLNYSKAEGLEAPAQFLPFDFVLTANETRHAADFETVGVEPVFAGLDAAQLWVRLQPFIFIMKRRA